MIGIKVELSTGGLRGGGGIFSSGSNTVKPGARSACFKSGESGIIRWDSNVSCGEEVSESDQQLLTSKCNPKGNHTEGI